MDSDEIIKLVNDYRKEKDVKERLSLVEKIYFKIKPILHGFISKIAPPRVAEDVLQDALEAVVTRMHAFRGKTEREFWSWCYRIARNKANDAHRRHFSSRLDPIPPEELDQLVEASSRTEPLSPGDKLDLEYAMNLLEKSKPECRTFLWKHFVLGWKFTEMAQELGLKSDAVRMKINRCLSLAQGLGGN